MLALANNRHSNRQLNVGLPCDQVGAKGIPQFVSKQYLFKLTKRDIYDIAPKMRISSGDELKLFPAGPLATLAVFRKEQRETAKRTAAAFAVLSVAETLLAQDFRQKREVHR